VFFKPCKRIIQTLPAIQTDPHNPECPMDGGEDHWLDSCMYAVAHASHGSDRIYYDSQDDWDDDDPDDGEDRGQTGYGM
jgi:hypothetical protein